jgi:hypothetical protein
MAIETTAILTTLVLIPAPIAIAMTPKTIHGMTVTSTLANYDPNAPQPRNHSQGNRNNSGRGNSQKQ